MTFRPLIGLLQVCSTQKTIRLALCLAGIWLVDVHPSMSKAKMSSVTDALPFIAPKCPCLKFSVLPYALFLFSF